MKTSRKITLAFAVIVFVSLVFLLTPSYYHDICETPKENIVWFYQEGPYRFVRANNRGGCYYCDNSLSSDQLDHWVKTMGAEWPIGAGLTPCLYVYPTTENQLNSAELCKKMVCGEYPNYNDVVGSNHGAWKSIRPRVFPID